jgi:hypothetical protein
MIWTQGDLFRLQHQRAPIERAQQAKEGPDAKFARSLFSKHGRDAWHVDLKEKTRFRDLELDKFIWSKEEVLASIGRLLAAAGITDCAITSSKTVHEAEMLHLRIPSTTFQAKAGDMQRVVDAEKEKAAVAAHDTGAAR